MSKSNKKREQNKTSKTPQKLTETDPKGQRERKPRSNVATTIKVEQNENVKCESQTSQTSEPSQTNEKPISFENLKRETDEILKLTDTKKYLKKEIYNNWSKYKKIDSDDECFDQGADFSALLQAPISGGGHFQFKSEKDWNTKINSKYNEYFTLDLKSINDALLTIPFYERFEIDTNLLSSNQILAMNNQALKYQNKYKPFSGTDNKISNTILLVDEKQSTFQEEISEIPELSEEIDEEKEEIEEEKEKLDESPVKNVDIKSEVNKFVKKVRELDTEVDDLLCLKKGQTESPSKSANKKDIKDDLLEEDVPVKKETKTKNTEVDLEQWLDDILDD